MSTLPAISIRELSKTFVLHPRSSNAIIGPQLQSLVYMLRNVASQGQFAAKPRRGKTNERLVHVLRDINLDLQPGEVVGIVGRNGAGKSTLLNILARVIDPTKGKVVIRGRLTSMLELSMGFIADRTISENIRLHARLGGLTERETRDAEDRVLKFAELEEFRDELLKNGPGDCFLRLAFAILIKLDANVILADEILAAGGAAFRQMCEAHLLEAGQAGRTVLLVSHDMQAIRRICSRAVWIDAGQVKMDGPAEEVVQAYEAELLAAKLATRRADEPPARILDLRLLDGDGRAVSAVEIQSAFSIECTFRISVPKPPARLILEFWAESTLVFILTCPKRFTAPKPKTFRASVSLPGNFCNERTYTAKCKLLLGDGDGAAVAAQRELDCNVLNSAPEDSVWSDWRFDKTALVAPRLEWASLPEPEEGMRVQP